MDWNNSLRCVQNDWAVFQITMSVDVIFSDMSVEMTASTHVHYSLGESL